MVSLSSDLNTPVLRLDSPTSWCRLRNQEFSPVFPLSNSPVRANNALVPRSSETICTPKPRSGQLVNYPVEPQNLNTAPSFGSNFFEDFLWPPAFNAMPVEADSTTERNTGNVCAGRLIC